MSKVPLRSFAVVVVFVIAVIAGCKSATDATRPVTPSRGGDCSSGLGTQNPDVPVVCVSAGATTPSVHPTSIRVWHVMSHDRATPPTLQWITRGGGGNLQIAWKDTGCFETPDCNGKGHCSAKAISGLGGGATAGTVLKTCRYTVTLDGKVLDPDAVIVACCS